MAHPTPVWLEPWMARSTPQSLVAMRAAQRRCGALTRIGRRCRRSAIVGARRCRIHLGPSKAHDRFHARQQNEFCAGRLDPPSWYWQQQQRARTRMSARLSLTCTRRWMEPGITLAFSDRLEARFRQDLAPHLRRHAREWENLPDAHRDRLRWHWRRYKLDRPGVGGDFVWDAKCDAVLLDVEGREARWPQYKPDVYDQVRNDGCGLPWVIHVDRRAPGWSDRMRPVTQAEVDRAMALPGKIKARFARPPGKRGWPKGQKRQGRRGKKLPPVEDLDVTAFLQKHAAALREHWRQCQNAAQEKRLAYTYRDFLAGSQGAGARWIALLRDLAAA
jgi:hypothetical protein